MEPVRELGKGLLIAVIGALFMFGARLPFRLGRLPGDISYHGRQTNFYFPIVTCIVLSVVLTLIFWIVTAARR